MLREFEDRENILAEMDEQVFFLSNFNPLKIKSKKNLDLQIQSMIIFFSFIQFYLHKFVFENAN